MDFIMGGFGCCGALMDRETPSLFCLVGEFLHPPVLGVSRWMSGFGRLLVGRAHRLPRSWVSWWSERSALGKDDSGGEAVIVLTSRGGAPDPPQNKKRADVLDVSWQEQLIHHVKDDHRRHSIEGESFLCLGEGELEKTLGMTHEGHLAGARQRSCACGHRLVLASHLRSTLQTNARCR